jgi:hypothetical protein
MRAKKRRREKEKGRKENKVKNRRWLAYTDHTTPAYAEDFQSFVQRVLP